MYSETRLYCKYTPLRAYNYIWTNVGEVSDRRIVELCDGGWPLHRLVRAAAETRIFAALRWRKVTETENN